ncbi:branched chain amino acid aminotransferase [Thiospirochaeta perfilievii]|uniref:Branched-chain-amino-acid aminotransferase n=1 Tax=Thiospirochaeta perfilievii TaxID=252967 RepID=A0A5C1QDI5_9SPIO|nr:aminotransferase class IV [Thiospirochaeta perfilievii]QEN05437.1 branched chain amino acid aminotransferase [Thiospirochaeta perfilievii]
MAFTLSMHPWVYTAKFKDDSWTEKFIEQEHLTSQEESKLSAIEREELLTKRNNIPELPLVNFTTQYGMGCFEGAKAYPQKDGSLKVFRPDENAKRMSNSMAGLLMPAIDPKMLELAIIEGVKRNSELGFLPTYKSEWEDNNFLTADAVYIRPFSYAEPGIGLGISVAPWVVCVSTNVSGYFKEGMRSRALVTDKVRATKGGTGWIKCDSNYVIPTLVKKRAEKDGFMEAIFLDAAEQKYIEEGSSCNIFFVLKNGTLVTPELGDTILPGITRKSVIELAKDMGINVEERKISIDEVLSDATETFVTGTAAGVTYLESFTYKGKETVFGDGNIGELTLKLQKTLKGIQYGVLEDKFGWMKSF